MSFENHPTTQLINYQKYYQSLLLIEGLNLSVNFVRLTI